MANSNSKESFLGGREETTAFFATQSHGNFSPALDSDTGGRDGMDGEGRALK